MSVAAANGGAMVAVPVVPVPVVAGEAPTPSNAPGISEEHGLETPRNVSKSRSRRLRGSDESGGWLHKKRSTVP